MKTTIRMISAASVLLALAAGCDWAGNKTPASAETDKTKPVGAVAVIDLDAVAEQLGHRAQIESAILHRDKDYVEQLGVIKANYEQKLEQIKQETGQTPTPEQSKYLVRQASEFNRSMQQNTLKAKQSLKDYETSLIQQYRAQVKPFAQEVAAERGLGVVLIKSETVLAHDLTVDITGPVVERIRAKQAETAKANAGAAVREETRDGRSARDDESYPHPESRPE